MRIASNWRWFGLTGIIALAVIAAVIAFTNAQGSGSHPITPAEVHQLATQAAGDGAGSAVGKALADGSVTQSEYRTAVQATIECLKDAGISVHDVQDTGDRIRFSIGGGQISRDEVEAQQRTYDSCYNENERAVDIAWAAEGH